MPIERKHLYSCEELLSGLLHGRRRPWDLGATSLRNCAHLLAGARGNNHVGGC